MRRAGFSDSHYYLTSDCMTECAECGKTFALDRFWPDRVLCDSCAEELGCERDGSDREEEEGDE